MVIMKLSILLPFIGLAYAVALDPKANTSNVNATTAAGIDTAKLTNLNLDTQAKAGSNEKGGYSGRGGDDDCDDDDDDDDKSYGGGHRGGRGRSDYWVNHRGSGYGHDNYKRADLAVVAKGHGHGYHGGRPAPHHGHHSHGRPSHYKRSEEAKTNGTAAKSSWGDDDCDSDDDDDDYGYGRGHGGRGRNEYRGRDWDDDNDDEDDDWKTSGESSKTK
ncbi:hypothetical protein CYLTODRAFT_128122 [Cylindrobasidium torrendii FP15055 ss-10]|uniref:Uncharacterized protein n=1 Tax=Cylindrobasidium torrendii FP15055 ss-10 TaxID=1314674 RepID=A0A0D7BP42_9AGAR|nr:hypothetical protein CYLTODRAFT_128122 [Cylindrobasidium torrendii FP15055 ss-10]